MCDSHEAVKVLKEQLEWKGPSGKVMGHVVLKRELAIVVLQALDKPKEIC